MHILYICHVWVILHLVLRPLSLSEKQNTNPVAFMGSGRVEIKYFLKELVEPCAVGQPLFIISTLQSPLCTAVLFLIYWTASFKDLQEMWTWEGMRSG